MNMEENMEETRVETTVEDRVGTRVEDRTEEPKADDQEEQEEQEEEDPRLEIRQLQGLVVQLREGLHCALVELSELRQRTHCQEDTLQTHLRDVDHKIIGLKNSLNTFKEELGGAVLQVKEVSCRQREVQKKMELLHTHHSSQSRKSSKGDLLLGEGHSCLTSQSDLNVIQHYFSSTTNNNRSTASTQTCVEAAPQRAWRKNSREELDASHHDHNKNRRQTAALELLESERVYVSYLSLLLKANISFNGSEALVTKDKRLFPSSLRFLIQQHLELLHTLQERVLKCQWQGIMGDVFMKLTSKESDFLDFYVSYLKELPDCLAVVSILTSSSANTAALLECDMMGDESRPSLHTLLLQPVQRIPQYTLLLQGLLRQTEADHPDYFLILVSIQQFRSFTSQYQQLLQHNQDLLHTTRKDRSSMKQLYTECGIQTNTMGSPCVLSSSTIEHVNQVKRSKQRLLDQIQSRTRTTYQDYQVYSDWDRDPEPEPQRYHKERSNALPYFSPEPAPAPPNLPYFSPEPAPPNPKQTAGDPSPGLRSIPESDAGSEASCKHHLNSRGPGGLDLHPGAAGSALAQALGEFLLPGETPEMEGLCEGDGVSLHDASVFDQCSSSSSDSSIDIAFVRCPKSSSASHRAVAANVPTSREAYGAALGQGGRYSKFPGRGCVSPDEAVMMRHSPHRPLQASQRKSKSLNGLQLDSTVSGVDAGPDHGHRRALERQGSNKGCPTPTRRGQSSLGNSPHSLGPDKHITTTKDIGGQVWGEEPKWRGGADEMNHTPLSERSRKQEKGGFRSSFKRLFKKKSVEDKKEKSETSDHESSKTQRPGQLEADRGTAV